MKKKILLLALFSLGQLSTNFTNAANSVSILDDYKLTHNLCDAPAPDSFWVSSRGSNYITAEWTPVSLDASYLVRVYARTSSTMAWIPIDSFNNIFASTITVYGVHFVDECKMTISTRCVSGEESIYYKSLQDKIIIELSTGGRIPVNPVPISCLNFPAPNTYNWVGFKVEKNNGYTVQNTFEVVVTHPSSWETKVSINRVYENNVLFASTLFNEIPPPTLITGNIFKMIEWLPNAFPFDIGKLVVTKNGASINLCKESQSSWNNLYNFTPMKATMNGLFNSPLVEDLQEYHHTGLSESRIVVAQSPFFESLNIFFNPDKRDSGNMDIILCDLKGNILVKKQIQANIEQLVIPTINLPVGIYILKVETSNERQILKVVKSEG